MVPLIFRKLPEYDFREWYTYHPYVSELPKWGPIVNKLDGVWHWLFQGKESEPGNQDLVLFNPIFLMPSYAHVNKWDGRIQWREW